MTELFDPPIDKETLPRSDVPFKHCLIIAALALAPVTTGIAIIEGDINLRSVASWIDRDGDVTQGTATRETFCENVARKDSIMAELVGRTFCGHGPKSPAI